MLYPQAFAVESILERCVRTHGRKQCLIKVIQTATLTRISLPLSLFLSLSQSVCLPTCTVLFFFLLINTLFVSLRSVFVAILFCKAERPRPLSLTTGLVIRMWCSDCCNLSSISNWGPKLRFKQLQAKATQDQHHHHSGVSSAYA